MNSIVLQNYGTIGCRREIVHKKDICSNCGCRVDVKMNYTQSKLEKSYLIEPPLVSAYRPSWVDSIPQPT